MKFHRHVFVCTRNRGADHPRGCCATKGSEALALALKLACKEAGLGRVVRVQESGCLDQCGKGATVVVYPEAVWYGGVTEADVAEIVERHLVGGEPVERLRIPDDELTGKPLPEGVR